jgi:hypothetical protein
VYDFTEGCLTSFRISDLKFYCIEKSVCLLSNKGTFHAIFLKKYVIPNLTNLAYPKRPKYFLVAFIKLMGLMFRTALFSLYFAFKQNLAQHDSPVSFQ